MFYAFGRKTTEKGRLPKRRKKTMKKAFSVLLTLVMVMGFGAFPFTGAAAKTGDTDNQPAWTNDSRGNLHKVAKMLKKESFGTDDPKGKEVIVLFADPDSPDVSKAEADKIETVHAMAEESAAKGRSEVEIASGITINKDEVWEFAGSDDGDAVTVAVATSEKPVTEATIEKLESQNIIEAASPNFRRHICADGDPYRGYQWALDAYPGMGVDSEWYEEDGETVKNVGSAENIVAVIDTGIYYNHPDLKGQIWNNPFGSKLKGKHGFDFVNGDQSPEDDNGHGTHCAGIIGAATDGSGVQGVSQKVSLMALKVLDADGGGWDSDIIAAFNYVYKAMDMGANVVAINCSFGSEEPNDIMEEVINKVGRKGAVTVCAAGNEEENNDEVRSYPACCDSEYVISVAATKNSGDKAELVSFSNYGKDSVDIAAPGTDILSTVSYNSFNPTLYGDNEEIVKEYFDGSAESVEALKNLALTNMESADIKSSEEAGFMDGEGIAIHFDNDRIPAGENKMAWQYVAIPYSLPADRAQLGDVAHSLMIRTLDGPQELSFEQYMSGTFSKVLLLDVPQKYLDPETAEGKKFLSKSGVDILMDETYAYQIVAGNDDYWSHMEMSMLDAEGLDLEEEDISVLDETDPDRALLILGSTEAGEFTAYIDDIGMSQYVTDTSVFGKYDFYSGTSMATPYVAGAAALVKAANPDKEYGPEMLIGDILSMANDEFPLMREEKIAVGAEGPVDFAKKGSGFWVGISSVTADTAKKQVKLKGKFGGVDELKIKIKKDDEETVITPEQIVSKKDKEIILKDNGWINNVVDITVEGTRGGKTKTSSKKDLYVVKGKNKYSTFAEAGSEIASDAAVTTNGRMVYAAQSVGDTILKMDTGSKDYETEEIASFTKSFIKKNFTAAKNMSKTEAYDFRFGDDLVKIGGNLYVKCSFCDVAGGGEGSDDDWSHSKAAGSAMADDEDKIPDSFGTAWAEETYLFKINISSGKISKLKSPAGTDELTDSRLASYNGSLYLLGGINESADTFSKKVYSYNASKNTWTAKTSLPEGRAGGKVLQTGNKLIYTLGYCAKNENSRETPENYIYNGSKWTKSSKKLSALDADMTIVCRGEKEYFDVEGSVGICADGLVYIGVPVNDYGDTFTYSVKNDKFTATGYNYTKDLDDVYDLYYDDIQIGGLAVGSKIIGFDADDSIVGIAAGKAIKSGLFTIKKSSVKNGKITGAGTFMPGTICTVKAIANPGYYVKSLTFAGKSGKSVTKGMSASACVTKDVNAKATTAKLKVSSVKSLTLKRGKTASLKAKIKPAAAAKQWKLAYKSSNSKYAKVSAYGKVTAKKAGKGKTVKIRIMLKGTSKTLKTVKVKIK